MASKIPTVEDHIDAAGFGPYQQMIFGCTALLVVADGMEMTVISMLREPLMEEFGIDDYAFAALGSCIFAGLLIGNLVGGFLADQMGRRPTLILMGSIFCVAGVLSAVALDVWTFAITRFFCGLAVGSMVPVSDTHVLEWSPSEWRAKMAMMLIGVAFAVGTLFACGAGILVNWLLAGNLLWWRAMLLLCVIPGIISLPLIIFFLPESPHFLFLHDRNEELKEKLKELNEYNGTPLLADGECSKGEHGAHGHGSGADAEWNLADLFSRHLWYTTLYLTIAFTACGYIYYGHIFIYPRLLEELHGLQMKEAYGAVAVNSLVEMAVIFGSMFLMDWDAMGRRGTMMWGFALVMVTAILAAMEEESLSWFMSLNAFVRAMVAGPFTVIYIYAGELMPSTLRATAISFSNSFGRIAAMVSPVLVTAAFHISVNLVFAIFATVALLGAAASYFHRRETLGKPLLLYVTELEDLMDEEEKPLKGHDTSTSVRYV